MNIAWHGQNCFRISCQPEKGTQVNILLSPFGKETGLKAPRLDAEIIISQDSLAQSEIGEKSFIIRGPGEYDIKGVYIHGIPFKQKSAPGILYVIEAENIKICHLGEFNQPQLASEQLELVGETDILMVPVGGEETMNPQDALKVMSQIEPKITLPMGYHTPGLKVKREGVDKFLKALGVKALEPIAKLQIKKKDIGEDEAKVILLSV